MMSKSANVAYRLECNIWYISVKQKVNCTNGYAIIDPPSLTMLFVYTFGVYLQSLLTKRNVSKDGQQFHQYQQNEQPPQIIKQLIKDNIWIWKYMLWFLRQTHLHPSYFSYFTIFHGNH